MSIVAHFICQSCGFKLADPNQECINCGYKQITINGRGLMQMDEDKLIDKIRKILNVTNNFSNTERAKMIEAVCGISERDQRIEELAYDYGKFSEEYQDILKKNLLLKNEINEVKEESVKLISELKSMLNEAFDVIKFYGDKKECCYIDGESMSIMEKGASGYIFGKRARTFLKKYKKN